jgi:hypothetical protein
VSNSHPERSSPQPPAPRQGPTFVGTRGQSGQSLADVLERVLDKGIVIVGDIQVRLLDIELLTIKIRLLVCSVDKAEEIGLNWWKFDPNLTAGVAGATLPVRQPRQLQAKRRPGARRKR